MLAFSFFYISITMESLAQKELYAQETNGKIAELGRRK